MLRTLWMSQKAAFPEFCQQVCNKINMYFPYLMLGMVTPSKLRKNIGVIYLGKWSFLSQRIPIDVVLLKVQREMWILPKSAVQTKDQ